MSQSPAEEARLMTMFNDALNYAHEQIKNGTASSQVLTTVLKMGSQYTHDQLELKKLESEIILTDAKVRAIEESTTSSALLAKVINDVFRYRGEEPPGEDVVLNGIADDSNVF